MAGQTSPVPEDSWGGGGCPAGFGRRSFLQGIAGAGLVATGRQPSPPPGGDQKRGPGYPGEPGNDAAVPFYGEHQAGITTPSPDARQAAGNFVAFDVTADNRKELTDLFRTLTARAAFLTAGGTAPTAPPGSPQPDDGVMGPRIPADALTITVGVGADLFNDRYGLAARKPVQLVTMTPFHHDDLNPALSNGDLLIQLCAGSRDTAIHALLEIIFHTKGAMRPRWSINGMHSPPRPVGASRDFFGFKDGIANPDPTSTDQMNQWVWVQPDTDEPAWTAGGTYQVVRIVHFDVEKWQGVPLAQQERIFGRRKVSGAPMYALDPGAPDTLDPVYTNDPEGLITPLNAHIRLANPQTPQTTATSTILRRSYEYQHSPETGGAPDVGHAFCCFQRHLDTYIAMQTRLEDELLVPYITPKGGGYFFALPGVSDRQDYYARGLLA
ncbi:Dyp-type peroxidase [Actinoallomurus sp. NPDC052308]|uniref:Dyp-type peroxidase n=1 Tax=Actinoallomurus sp. NPDC052308 TaxID=3155530 RepID=UPI00341ECF14